MKIEILEHLFLNEDGTFLNVDCLMFAGRLAGICYDEEGYHHLLLEDEKKTLKRIDRTLSGGHHSVYDHTFITFNFIGIPKILAMMLNNEHQYTTSEKSARYTAIKSDGMILTDKEVSLYYKWLDIFKVKIKSRYGDIFNDNKIHKLAQENARYMVSVFMPTEMAYTTSFRQINYIASWMKKYINEANILDEFESKIAYHMQDFLDKLEPLHVLEEGLMQNEKNRSFSLFGKDLDRDEDYFGKVYNTSYLGSFAQLAQAHRHRTIDYEMERLEEKQYYIPPILLDDSVLVDEWLRDIESVSVVVPQGELVRILESGRYDKFILKCKERLCSAAQLEINDQTRETLLKYRDYLKNSGSYLYDDILKYCNGARCTFPDFKCSSDCKFKEGKQLVRKI